MTRAGTSPFGDNLRRLREAAGLTQEELADRSGLSRDAVSALERGRRRHPQPQTIRALATALGLSDDDVRMLRASTPLRPGGGPTSPVAEPPSTLPTPLTRLVGRQRELEELRQLLFAAGARLVTLTGPGGVGKTRVALELARDPGPKFTGDVAFVSLSSVQDPALILPTIAEALGVRDTSGQSLIERLGQILRGRRTLLVLDNLEHLPEAASPIADLLIACGGLVVLATSRAALRLSGEQEFPIPPLPLRPEMSAVSREQDDSTHVSRLTSHVSDAVALFVQRARAVSPEFVITEANVGAVAEICARLDGLPLAIELAASRVKVLPPETLLARLGSGLAILAGGPRDQAARLQSMRAAIAWSYDLLDPADQALFRRLSVFPDAFTLDEAEAVTASIEGISAEHMVGDTSVLDGVSSLVDKNLIRRLDSTRDHPRFGMLTSIREYGLEKLHECEESAAALRAHASYYLEMAERAANAFRQRTAQEDWLDRLEQHRSNFSVALMRLNESGDQASLLRLAGALAWFWYIRGPLSEGRSWLERALAPPAPDAPDAVRIQAMVGAGLLAHFQDDDGQARAWLEASLTQTSGLDDPWLRAFALLLLGIVAEDQGDYTLAEVRFADALGLFRAADDESNAALALVHLGVAAWGMGDVERAEQLCQQAVELQRPSRDSWGVSISLGYLGLIAGERGEYSRAAVAHRESLELRWQAGVWEDVAASFADLAALAMRVDRPEQAARLFGAADALREEAGRPAVNLPERAIFERAEERARLALGDSSFAQARAEGRALPREQAVSEAAALANEIARIGS